MSQAIDLPDIHWMDINPTKRSLQLHLLGTILHTMKRAGPTPITAVCLPGESAWDIDYFLMWDCVHKVVGIERDPVIAAQLRERTAGNEKVEIFEGEVSQYFLSTTSPVELVYLDYCSNLNLSVVQDIDILLRKRALAKKGRCVVSFLNARETVSASVCQKRLFDELEETYPSGESWEGIDADRRRCIAFNALLHRYRSRFTNPLIRANRREVNRRLVGTSAVHRWHRYATTGGAMLTGYFTLRSYGCTNNVSKDVVPRCPDKWYVRGRFSLKQVDPKKSTNALSREEKKRGRDLGKALHTRRILRFYEKNGYTPSQAEVKSSYPYWTPLVRELGLCPRHQATLVDVQTEIRNIHKREGTIRMTHLRVAKLPTRTVIRRLGRSPRKVFETLLTEMGIPHDLRTDRERWFREMLRNWITYLESGKDRRAGPHYAAMRRRGLLKYEDAVVELRSIEARYG